MKANFLKGLTGILLVSTCAFGGASSTVGGGNPASHNCILLGGTLEDVKGDDGHVQSFNCAIEEWSLYRQMSDRNLVNIYTSHGPAVGLPNPAAMNCIDIGGALRYQKVQGSEIGFCIVDEWALFHAIDARDDQ